ncbi:monocarboxylate transporter 12-like isoform X2 [Acanthaster planci]|nr:monocarboxylate transporter 12-like isoform X2 [Acanthaster planci]
MAKCSHLTECHGRGLVIVSASFVIHLLITAITRCTGVLFSSFQNEFLSTAAQTGAISSIMSASSFFGSTLGGVLENRFGCRITAFIGGLLNIAGMLGCALTRNIYQMYVTGALAGLGNGISYVSAVVIVAQYFKKYYSIAASFMTTGDSVGIMMFGPLMHLLLSTYGWRGTLVVTCAITANICVAGAVCRPNRQSSLYRGRNFRDGYRSTNESGNGDEEQDLTVQANETRRDSSERRADTWNSFRFAGIMSRIAEMLRLNILWQSYRFSMFCFTQCAYIISLGCYLIYLVPRATTSGVPDEKAALLLSVIGIGGLVGRPFCGVINRKVPSVIIYDASILTGGCAVLMAQFGTYGHFVASAAVFGLAVGFQRTISPVLIREYVGTDNLGSAVGLYSGFGGVADLIGPILAGALYDAIESYSVLFYFFAGIFFTGFVGMLFTPLLKRIEPGVRTKGNATNI